MTLPLPLPSAASKPFDVVGFGENSLDLVAVVERYPARDAKDRLLAFEEFPGGQTATALVACARLGWRARYVGSVGLDAHGEAVRDALTRERVETSAVRRLRAQTRYALLIVDHAGHRTVLERRDEALAWPPAELDGAVLTSGRVLLVDATDLPAAEAAATMARAASIPTVVDVDRTAPGIDRLLRAVDIVIVPEAFATTHAGPASAGEALLRLDRELQPALAVVTLGAHGSLARCNGREIRTPGFRVPVVDATGAGDAFRGGLVAAWLLHGPEAPVDTLLQYANAVAALSCTKLGAQTGLPGRDAVHALVTGASVERSN